MFSSNANIQQIVANVQYQLQTKGSNSFSRLRRAFIEADVDSSGCLNRDEFEELLENVGIFLSKVETQKLVKHYDTNKDGKLSYSELLDGLVGSMSNRRARMVQAIFEALDSGARGYVTLEEIFSHYNAGSHPSVVSGSKTAEEVYDKFVDNFNGFSAPADTQVTIEEFLDLYRGISACQPDDDDKFIKEMEFCWGLKENSKTSSFQRHDRIEKLERTLKDKIYMKTSGAQQDNAALLKTFKFMDLDDSGKIDKVEFKKALERVGMNVSDEEVIQLFQRYDKDGNGLLDYEEFTSAFQWDKSQANKHSLTQSLF